MQEQTTNVIVGISVGDLNGIGSEVILKSFEDSRMMDFCTPVIFASNKTISFQKNKLGLGLKFQGIQHAKDAVKGKINVVNVWKETPDIEFGKATEAGGKYAIKSLKAAVQALKNKEVDVMVTAPINKKNVQSEDFNFPGHTDYLAQALEGKSLMFMVTDNLKVGLMTDHVAVKEVSGMITRELVHEKVLAMEASLKKDFRIRKPKIAVLGINPHVGDEGVIGQEDDEVVKPAVQELMKANHLVYGPYAADSFFTKDHYTRFDAVLAAYHDQGLIPFKTLSFGKGVNFTAGLSRVRTSPDHGTAYEIAGKNEADPSSFREAVYTAIRIFRNREEFEELTSNPLQKQKMNKAPRK